MKKILLLFFLLTIVPSVHGGEFTELYKMARNKLYSNSCEEAINLLNELKNSDYLLKDYVVFDLAECYRRLGKNEKAQEELDFLVKNYQFSPLYKKAYSLLLELQPSMAEELAESYLENVSKDDFVAKQAVEILLKNGKEKKATLYLKDMFLKGGQNIDYAYGKLRELKIFLTSGELRKGLQTALYEKKMPKRVIKILSDNDMLDEELKYLLGKAYFQTRDYNATIRYLSDTNFREGKIILATAYFRINDRIASDIILRRLAKDSKEGLYSLYLSFALLKKRENRILEAEEALQKLLEYYPENRNETLWQLAWCSIISKKYKEAERILHQLLQEKNYRERDKIFFWLGKIKEYQGEKGDSFFLNLKNGESYYAYKLGFGASLMRKNEEIEPIEDKLPDNIGNVFARAKELSLLSMNDYAASEINTINKNIKKEFYPLFANLLYSIKHYKSAVILAERFKDVSIYAYPLAYEELVKKFADDEKIDKFLVFAVMREESRFDINAVSQTGAVGLMQLMPKTALQYPFVRNVEDIKKPENNIRAGVKYLSKLLKNYKNYYYALSAYNAGESNVNNWLKRNYTDEDEFVEDIPFGETRNYVKKVIKSYFIYKMLYPER